ncbi:MAG: type II toxin-antitoxin system VapC family toxin [Acidimicrobiales bacterium]
MSDPVVVLDSGVVDQVSVNKEFRCVLRDLVESGWTPVIPTVVLAEVITGRHEDASVNQVVSRLGTVDTTQATARRAGKLRFGVKRAGTRRIPSGIDAIVAAHVADAGAGVVFTTDPSDLRRLLADFPLVVVEKP